MFKKLKDKIAEEVKQSPLKSVQQLAQAVVSPSSSSVFEPSSSNDKFCIEEADIEDHIEDKPGGFTSVALTGQTTSPIRNEKYGFRSSTGSFATEVDNLFTVFESQPTNFHAQSDWESASELEDRCSQVEHINKESLYEAYRKVYNRHNKMKNKYQELVTHYRQLEREKDKAKTVLSETQDKALLRISELKEQCLLEQQAKAHLEEALRNELEERDHVINTLKTKVQYLKGINEDTGNDSLDNKTATTKGENENLIDFTDNLSVLNVPSQSATSHENTVWFEEQLKKLEIFLKNKTFQIEDLKRKLEAMKKRDGIVEKTDSKVLNFDKIHILEQHSENDFILNQTVVFLINELAKEVKSLREDTVNHLKLEVNQQKNNKNCLFDETADIYSGRDSSYCNQQSSQLIKELEAQNVFLNQKLNEERLKTEHLKTEIESLSNIFVFVKAQLKTTNENLNDETYGMLNMPVFQPNENDLIKELQCCLTNLFNTRSTLGKFKNSKIQLENELRQIKEDLYSLKANKVVKNYGNISLETESHEETVDRIVEENKILKETLLRLQTENSNMVVKLESLMQEMNHANKSNQELKDCIIKLEDSLATSSEECNKEKAALETKTLSFNSEKNTLENKIITIEQDFEQFKKDHVLLAKENETISNKLAFLKKEYDDESNKKDVLQSKLNAILNESEQRNEDYKILLNTKEKLSDELSIVTSEKNTFLGKITNLEKEFVKIKTDYKSVVEENKKLVEHLNLLQNENDIIVNEKMTIRNQFDKLEKDFENNRQEHKEISKRFSDEIFLLKKDINELNKEKQILQNKMTHFCKLAEDKETECVLSIEMQNKLSEELANLRDDKDNIYLEKINLQNNILHLQETLKINEKEHSLTIETINKLNDEIVRLKKECEIKNNEHAVAVESKNTLTNESTKLQKEYDDVVCILNDTRKNLETRQETCEELDKKLNAQYELFKAKCEDAEEKYQENIHLKTDIENLLNKINNLNSVIEHFTVGQSFILNQLLLKLTLVKNIRQSQRNLVDFVLQFRSEIMNEINNIRAKIENDMMYQINKITQENEVFKKQTIELDCKSKQDIDSYNSKIKNLQTEFQNANEISNHQWQLKESPEEEINQCNKMNCNSQDQFNKVEVKHNKAEVNISNLDSSTLCYQDSEDNLNQAICIMQSLCDCFKHHFEALSDQENLTEEEYSSLKTHIFAVNSFLNKCEFRFKGENFQMESTYTTLVPENFDGESAYLSEIDRLELTTESKTGQWYVGSNYSNNSSCPVTLRRKKPETRVTAPFNIVDTGNNSLEIQQLQEEVKLKEDIIKKLQSIVEEYEQVNNAMLSDKCLLKNAGHCKEPAKLSLLQSESIGDSVMNNTTNSESDREQRLLMLQQENEALHHNLIEIKENCDTEIKKLIADYENKIEEKDKDKLHELEKIGGEKTHVVKEMKEQIENLQQDLDERGDAFEKLYEKYQQIVKSSEEEIEQLRNSYEKEMREADKKWRSCLDRRLAEEEARHQDELENLSTEWTLERKELESTSRLALSAVESGSTSSALLRHQIQALTMQLTELQSNKFEGCDQERAALQGIRSSKSSPDCTEIEYLRNILYKYMMGKEPLVLAKVLCALMKFDENQTKDIVLKEEQKITLFGQLGIL